MDIYFNACHTNKDDYVQSVIGLYPTESDLFRISCLYCRFLISSEIIETCYTETNDK